MLNNIVLMGRLTRDPELRYTPNDIPVASFTLACSRDYGKKGEQEADFFDIVAWRQTGEFASKYFSKGQQVAVDGRLQTRKWTDKEGNNRISYEIIAGRVYFAEGKRENSAAAYAGSSADSGFPGDTGFSDLPDDDGELPF